MKIIKYPFFSEKYSREFKGVGDSSLNHVAAIKNIGGKLVIFVIIITSFSCNEDGADAGEQILTPKTLDCVSNNCDEFIPSGESYYKYPNGQQGVFSGIADPCMRKDPNSDRLWITYTWQAMHAIGDGEYGPGTDIHYAHSDDGGNSWIFDGKLWQSTAVTPLINGQPTEGYVDYEVSNFLPVNNNNGNTTWYGVRVEYFLPDAGGYAQRPINSFKVGITQASSFADLKAATPDIAGTRHTAAEWNFRFRFNDLSPEVAHVDIWNEPSFYSQSDTLFLIMRGLTFKAGLPDFELSNIYVFAAKRTASVETFDWNYKGQLAGQTEAFELGGKSLTQIEITEDAEGKPVALLTPEDWSTTRQDFIHKGCSVVEVHSLSRPSLARYTSNNKLKLRAIIEASDQGELGPGAATYDANSVTGILFVKRDISTGVFRATTWQTNLHP